ncbi:serine hydrolase [Siminovitchia terrae]|uniref:serine hydrolase domain-containing protein n=1 Tax=Siminovitchia terrae TaxID=1914933 RepID=UPI001B001FAD|nr:serine hydrolase domain-containing protein [Siminovitchia terrae]GIN90383.1 serine hydrolase [Siminovitchia terrae]
MDSDTLQQEIFRIVQPYVKLRKHLLLSIGIMYKNQSATLLYTGSDTSFKEEDKPFIYEIGSISKVFTTTLLGEMIQKDLLSEGDSIGRYIPKLSNDHPVTLSHLANHTSGVPGISMWKSIINLFNSTTPRDPYCLFSLGEVIDYFYKHRKEPKLKFRYSNDGMGLLGHILAMKLNTDYETAIKKIITDPLHMEDTFILVPSEKKHRVLQGHDVKGREQQMLHMSDFMGAGAIRSNVDDMLKFIKAHISSENKGYQLTQKSTMKIAKNMNVGLGWFLEDEIVWHNGSTQGFSSFLGFDPAQQIGVIVLSNYRSRLFATNPNQIGTDILKLLRTS